jgi:hypothetical protein
MSAPLASKAVPAMAHLRECVRRWLDDIATGRATILGLLWVPDEVGGVEQAR